MPSLAPTPTPERRSRSRGARLALVGALLALLVLLGRPVIHSDGIIYYALSESLARDGDLNLQNQLHLNAATNRNIIRDYRRRGGTLAPPYTGGLAVLHFPVLFPMLVAHDRLGFLRSTDLLGLNLQGIPLVSSVAVLAATFGYLVLGALCTFEVLRRWVSDWWAVGVTLAVALSVPAVLHGTWAPSFCHVPGAFLVAAALYLTAGLDPASRYLRLRLVAIGALLGLGTFVRASSGALLPVWGAYILLCLWKARGGWRRLVGGLVLFALGALPWLLFLAAFNGFFYGHPFASAYDLARGDMVTHYRFSKALSLWTRNFVNLLGNPVRGVFVWAPVAVLGVIGLLLPRPRDRREPLRYLSLAGFAAVTAAMATWNIWWGGQSAGPRFLIEVYPFLAVGVAALVGRLRALRIPLGIVVPALTAYAVLVQVGYVMVSHSPLASALYSRAGHGAAREAYTAGDVLEAAFGKKSRDPRWPGRFAGRLWKGLQPSALGLAVRPRPTLIGEIRAGPGPEPGTLQIETVLDGPAPPKALLLLDVRGFDPRRHRRKDRAVRLVSEPIPQTAGPVTLRAVISPAAGTQTLEADGQAVSVSARRVDPAEQRAAWASPTLHIEASIRTYQPRSLSVRHWLVSTNPLEK